MHSKKLVVIGGGAAGFFLAVNAARLNPQLNVILLEKTGKLLSKVKVSGGGRCNVTHACFSIPELVKKYPRGEQFLKKAFHLFNTNDTIEWFSERGVQLHAEADGRMFPVTNDSQTIINCLLKEADAYKVDVRLNSDVNRIETIADTFRIHITGKEMIAADFVAVACGGFSKAAMFQWLKDTGHEIEQPVPSLFTFNIPRHPITALMGLSVSNAVVKIAGTKLKERGPLLITHWGLSGPVVLRLSAWGARELSKTNYQFNILVNWLGDCSEADLRQDWTGYREQFAAQKILNRNPFGLPGRLWQYLLEQCNIPEATRWAELKGKEQNKLIQLLTAFPFTVSGKTTFKEEFVTAGGIALSGINPQTMESKKVPNLFFAGEVMDVDGITGGFNFQNAWTSAFIAATTIATRLNDRLS
ncbi:MAG TPA: NAD(P)/FAD-dependent oxidoreductase [Sediminibacterium sp.]|nr:NAD(P)/FAD-dependent oxidoreductase [Sediminibacterium sp.]